MHIDVIDARRQQDIQHAGGKLPLHHALTIALLERRRQQPGADGAAIDKEMLHGAVAAPPRGLRDKAPYAHAARIIPGRDQRMKKVPPKNSIDGILRPAVARRLQKAFPISDKLERDIRMGHRRLLDDARDRPGLAHIPL